MLPKVPEEVLLSLSEMAGAEDQGSQRLLGALFVSSWREHPEDEGPSREGRKGWKRERETRFIGSKLRKLKVGKFYHKHP